MAIKYLNINQRFGTYALLMLIVLNFLGVPVFETLWTIGEAMLRLVSFV